MAVFSYKARTKSGQVVGGMVDADSSESVAGLLADKKLTVISITRKSAASSFYQSMAIFNRVSVKELVFFFRQLAVMIESDLPIVRVLRTLIKQTKSKYFKTVIADIADEIEGGAKLSDGMKSFPNVFSEFYINMIASGETSGRLSDVVNYLADQQEKDYDLRSRVKGAMYYPAFILFALVAVGALMMIFVVPQLTGVLTESGVELPVTTKILIGISDFLVGWWWLVIVGVVALFVGFGFLIRTDVGEYWFDWARLKVPIFGKIYKEIIMVRITRSLNTLIEGGVTVTEALGVIKDLVDNRIYEDIIEKAIKEVEEGSNLADSLMSDTRYIPISVSQMIAVGEETGKLDKVSAKLSDFYQQEVEASVRNLSVLIEPVIMIILAVGVAFFVLSVITPMWDLSSSI